jgi:tetratricopeptide (TPR) repeat protein
VGVWARRGVAVVVSLAASGGCLMGLVLADPKMDIGVALAWSAVPLAVVLAVAMAWAEAGRPQSREGTPAGDGARARVEGSAGAQAVGRVGDGSLVVGPGASFTNPVFHLGATDSRGKAPLPVGAGDVGGVLVVGDVPQEPAAFQPRAGLLEALGRPGAGRVSVVFAVTGIRGVGKTQVAGAYARRRIAGGWRLVAWVDASSRASVLAGLAQVAVAAGLGPAGEDAEVLAAGVRGWLEADGDRRLLVLDNAVDLDVLRPFLPAAGAAQVVVTSTRRSAAGLGTAVPVDVFTEEEALAFLAERTGLDDQEGAGELAGELGCLPLGLAQAAALIARQHLRYRRYLERLRAVPLAQYLGRVEGDAYPHKTAEAIVLSLQGIRGADPTGRADAVMSLVAVLAETGVSRRVLHLAGAGGEGDAGDQAAAMDAAAGLLADASLAGFSVEDAVVAHRLVMRAVREHTATEGRVAAVTGEAVRVLTGLADQIPEAWQDPAGVRELAGHLTALTGHAATSPAGPPPDLVRVRLRSVYLLNTLGDSTGLAITAAEPLARDCEQHLGADHPDTLSAITNLAYAYRAAGRVAEAIALLERTLADREQVLGDTHPNTLVSRNNLATAYQAAGRVTEAIPLFERTLADSEQVLGDTHPDTLNSRNNLAYAYESAGRLAEAVPLYERTLADREQVLGDTHPDTLSSRNNLAGAYRAAGRLAEAIPLFERTLADSEQVLGDTHPKTLTCRNNLAHAYQGAGRLAEAIPLYERNLADREQVLGGTHPNTLGSRNNLAHAYQAAGRVAEAIPLLERTLADREQVLGDTHPDTLNSRNNLAGAYQDAGRLAEAIPLLERTLADSEQVLGDTHPNTLLSRNNLAGAYQAAGLSIKKSE